MSQLSFIFWPTSTGYSVEREDKGLRRIAGFGVSLSRGSAGVIMFTYSSLLVTMCRNIITKLRETFLHQYIPFDSATAMHKIIAWLALVFTGMKKKIHRPITICIMEELAPVFTRGVRFL